MLQVKQSSMWRTLGLGIYLSITGCTDLPEEESPVSVSSPIILGAIGAYGVPPALGRGYDSLTGYSKNICIKAPIVSIPTEAFRTERPHQKTEAPSAHDAEVKTVNRDHYLHGIEVKYNPSPTSNQQRIILFYSVQSVVHAESLDLTRVELTEAGRKSIENNQWREVCGDEFVFKASSGVELQAIVSLEFPSKENRDALEKKANLDRPFEELYDELMQQDQSLVGSMKVQVVLFQLGLSSGKTVQKNDIRQEFEGGIDVLKKCKDAAEKALLEPDQIDSKLYITHPYPTIFNPALTQKDIETAFCDAVGGTNSNASVSSENKSSTIEDLIPATYWDRSTESSEWKRPKYKLVLGGMIVWAPGHPAIFIANGPILDYLRNLYYKDPSAFRLYGFPSKPIQETPDHKGQVLYMDHAAIYWNQKTNVVFDVHGDIYLTYKKNLETSGSFGYPQSPLYFHIFQNRPIWYQIFQGGMIYHPFTETTPQQWIGSGILFQQWHQIKEIYGFPVANALQKDGLESIKCAYGIVLRETASAYAKGTNLPYMTYYENGGQDRLGNYHDLKYLQMEQQRYTLLDNWCQNCATIWFFEKGCLFRNHENTTVWTYPPVQQDWTPQLLAGRYLPIEQNGILDLKNKRFIDKKQLVAERYFKMDGEDVIDLKTKLVWQKEPLKRMAWKDALSYCSQLEPKGSWRIPTFDELNAIIEKNAEQPLSLWSRITRSFVISPPQNYTFLPDMQEHPYWSSTSRGNKKSKFQIVEAFGFHFSESVTSYNHMDTYHYVRCVMSFDQNLQKTEDKATVDKRSEAPHSLNQ